MSKKVIPFIDLKSQYSLLEKKIQSNILKVLDHGQYILGPEVSELESKLSEFTGSKHCVAVASGTDALLISLMAIGIKPNDEIITTSFSFFSTAEVISLLGAKPVFADIDPKTCNIDPKKLKELISDKTRAIIPVSLYGQPSDMDEINEIARKAGDIYVIEDAAQSFGSSYKNQKSCNLSAIGCTSFFPSKPLGCYGDGGAIFTNDDDLAQAFKEIRIHGQSERYKHSRIGIGGRMDTIQCAIVLAKLENFKWEVKERMKKGQIYNSRFDELGIERVIQKEDRTSVFAQYTIMLDDRETIMKKLSKINCPTTIHYPKPINEQPVYKNLQQKEYGTPIASSMSDRVLSIPISAYLAALDQERILEVFEK